jgi:hypothetical protein
MNCEIYKGGHQSAPNQQPYNNPTTGGCASAPPTSSNNIAFRNAELPDMSAVFDPRAVMEVRSCSWQNVVRLNKQKKYPVNLPFDSKCE